MLLCSLSCRRAVTFTLILALSATLLTGCFAPQSMLRAKSRSALLEVSNSQEITIADDKLSDRTMTVLRTCNWAKQVKNHRQQVIDEIEPYIHSSTESRLLFAVAELCFKEGRKLELERQYPHAMRLYAQCLVYTYKFLFEPRFEVVRNSYSPDFRNMCILYNASSDRILRLLPTASP